MRVALAQINSHLGNFDYNFRKIVEFAWRAKERHCDIALFPESCLFGYHPMDLLKRTSVVLEQIKYVKKLERELPKNVLVVFGAFVVNPSKNGKPFYNAAIAIYNGKKIAEFHKELLPTYDVFDDARHIQPGNVDQNILRFKGKKILITICEDIWAWPVGGKNQKSLYQENPIRRIRPGSVDFILNLSASPFYTDKMAKRYSVTRQTARYLRAPMIYVNMVGGQDELIFDGASFAVDSKGKVFAQSRQFDEDLNVVDIDQLKGGSHFEVSDDVAGLHHALVLGIKDFVTKCGVQNVHLGLSGGIDSAVVACLAVDALGPHRVSAFALPGPFSSALSMRLAKQLAKNIGIKLDKISIQPAYRVIKRQLAQELGIKKFGLVHENLQARLRAVILMAVANHKNSLLLNTSNKSELATGYGTLYGDMAGGLSPIGDMLKRDVYDLAKYYNREQEVIPKQLIRRPPSAELRAHQKDADTLPPYPQLDQSVVEIIEKSQTPVTRSDRFLLERLVKSEFKRWQTPPILKVREYSFGQGRRMPIAQGSRA